MLFSSTVGLLLSSDEELQLVRSAALHVGLEPVNLADHLQSAVAALSEPPEKHEAVDPAAVEHVQLIVTDDECAAASGLVLGAHDSPLVIRISSEDRANTNNEDLPWILLRPLREQAVSAQLRQAMSANRIFADRHHSMLEELCRSRRIFDSVCNGITISDARAPDLPLLYVNPAFERMTGYPADEVCGRNCRFLQGKDTDQPGLREVRRAIAEQRDVRVLLKNYRKNGTPFWNELYMSPIKDKDGSLTHFVGIQNDVTAQVESAQKLDHMASHDSLTGLENRGRLMERLKTALVRARRSGGNVAVLFFDLDKFKHVNDVFGHEAGDRLLQVVAERLRRETRASEGVARLGGDEFVVVLEDFSDPCRPHAVMQRLTAKVGETVDLLGQQFHPSASVGMALFPNDGDTPDALLRVADFNMYTAKHTAQQTSEESLAKPG